MPVNYKKLKKKNHIFVILIHCSLRSEFKMLMKASNENFNYLLQKKNNNNKNSKSKCQNVIEYLLALPK